MNITKKQLSATVKTMCMNFRAEFDTCNGPQAEKQFDLWYNRFGRKFLESTLDNEVVVGDQKIVKDLIEGVEKFYDEKGNASHYDSKRLNAIVKFERTYGTMAVMTFCEITADRYRERIGKKDNQSLKQEVMKINWYENAAEYFHKRVGTTNEIIVNNKLKKGLPWK